VSDELAILAGGDQYELAVEEIRQDVADAKARLRAAHPYFYDQEVE
jgi:hypothetical protein